MDIDAYVRACVRACVCVCACVRVCVSMHGRVISVCVRAYRHAYAASIGLFHLHARPSLPSPHFLPVYPASSLDQPVLVHIWINRVSPGIPLPHFCSAAAIKISYRTMIRACA